MAVVAVAIAVRLTANFSHANAPGMDAAYYPLQAQWLIQHGELNVPGMPLIFWLQALLAKVIMVIFGCSLQEAVALSSRVFDGCIPPLAAIPMMLLGFRFSGGRKSAVMMCAAAAVLTVLSPPIFRMAGDLQKNAFGLVWMAMAILAMRQSLAAPQNIFRWLVMGIVFVLAGLTHVGAFAVTLVVVFGSLLGYAVAGGSEKENPIPLVKVVIGLVVLLGVVALLVPSQLLRLGTLLQKAIVFVPLMSIVTVVVYAVLAWVLIRLWRKEHFVLRCDKAVAIGASIGIAFLFAPIFNVAIAMRFQLMSIVPAAVLLLLYATVSQWDLRSGWRHKTLLWVTGILAVVSPLAMQGPVIGVEAAGELKEFAKSIENPEKTLVVAPHGVEFWAGHLMNTKVRKSTVPKHTRHYDRVLILKPNHNTLHMRPHEGPPRRGGSRGSHGPPMEEMTIPETAKKIRSGEFFDFYEY